MAKLAQHNLSIRKPLAPVYLLFGTQDYLIDRLQMNIINEALSEDTRGFNLSRYDMREVPVEEALDDANTPPFFGEKKVVVLEKSFFLSGAKARAKIDQDPAALEQYASQPSPDTVLIITANVEKLDRRKKLVRNLEKTAEVYELSRPTDGLIYSVLKNIAVKLGSEYTKDGHEQLVATFGPNLMQLANEVKKCALYCGSGRPIDRQAVMEIGSHSPESNVFLLVDKVMQQQTAEAIHLLHDLVSMKEEPLKLLALLERQFRIVYQVSYYQKSGYTQKQIAGKIGVHPYAIKLASEQTRRYGTDSLKRALEKCADADYRMKTGAQDKLLALEMLIHDLSSG